MLLIHPGQYPDIYEVQVILQRLSGDDRSWQDVSRSADFGQPYPVEFPPDTAN